jgi:hypothetical protein
LCACVEYLCKQGTLTSVFSKIYSLILDNRLREWYDEHDSLTDFQFGFRSNRSTIDCVFVLNTIVNKVLSGGKKQYCAFIDFTKAFDLVYINGVWYTFMQMGVSCKFVNSIRCMYESVKACVRSLKSVSDFFKCNVGVKQGEPISPLLFL